MGVCEVPRGMLIHHYWIGEDGKLTGANCIIPTNQNMANLEADMQALVPQILDKPVEAMRLTWRCWCGLTTRASRARCIVLKVESNRLK